MKLSKEAGETAVVQEMVRLWTEDVYQTGDVVSAETVAQVLDANRSGADAWRPFRFASKGVWCVAGKWTLTPPTTTTTTAPLGTPVSFTLPYQKMLYNQRPWTGAFSDTDLDRCITQIIDPSMYLYPGSSVTVLAYACEDVYEHTTRLYVYAFPNRTATTPAAFVGATTAYPLTSLKVTATQQGTNEVTTFDAAPTGSWTTWSWDSALSVRDGAITFTITSLTHAATATTG